MPQTFIEDVTVVTGIRGPRWRGDSECAVERTCEHARHVLLKGAIRAIECRGLAFSNGVAQTTLTVPNARLWSDTDPYLYALTMQTDDGSYTLQVGIRTIAVQGRQILLNGKPIKMNGFGRHEDFIASGKGLNLPLMVKDYQLMRWTGANSYRTSHYPYSEEEMQLADREGFLIIDEIPAVSLQFENDENAAIRLKDVLATD